MKYHNQFRYFYVQWIAGTLSVAVLYCIFVAQRMGEVHRKDYVCLGALIALTFFIYGQSGLYLNKSKFNFLLSLFSQWTLVVSTGISLLFLLKISEDFSRAVLTQLYFFGFISQIVSYWSIKKIWSRVFHALSSVDNALVFGRHFFSQECSDLINRKRRQNLVGYLEQFENQVYLYVPSTNGGNPYPFTHSLIDSFDIQTVYLPFGTSEFKRKKPLIRALLEYPVELVWHLQFDGDQEVNNRALEAIVTFPFIVLSIAPSINSPFYYFFKRAVDIMISTLMLLALSPLLLLTALIIKVDSSGPVLFRQKRHGLHGEIIDILKFRSMYNHQADRLLQATPEDERITAIGRFIRRTSIDELPQLWNVLQGTLSLVGPRPHPIEFDEYYGPKINEYMLRHRIKPGITGLAQINGARGQTETVDKMLHRIEYDLEYIRTQSFILDLRILFLTPFALLIYKGY